MPLKLQSKIDVTKIVFSQIKLLSEIHSPGNFSLSLTEAFKVESNTCRICDFLLKASEPQVILAICKLLLKASKSPVIPAICNFLLNASKSRVRYSTGFPFKNLQ